MPNLTPNHVHVDQMDMCAGLRQLQRRCDDWSFEWFMLDELILECTTYDIISPVILKNGPLVQWAMAMTTRIAKDEGFIHVADRCETQAYAMMHSLSEWIVVGPCDVCWKK